MNRKIIASIVVFFIIIAAAAQNNNGHKVVPGAKRITAYMPKIKNKKVAIVANHTSLIGNTHLVDSLLALQVNVVKIFSPEHGFRGVGDAGEVLENETDKKTGLPIISLYGEHYKPSQEDLAGIEVLLFDIQDVGVRFYTYISTMHYVMEACAENIVDVVILDRPNPNGFFVDGPLLDSRYKSFVGMHPVPLVHGMTIAEYANMINGEYWLADSLQCRLSFVLCKHYDHTVKACLTVNPSPNLQNMRAIYMYPSLGIFEGTVVSVGRGTDYPFQYFGHPAMQNSDFYFVPRSIEGVSKYPRYRGKKCYGLDLRDVPDSLFVGTINLQWLMLAYDNIQSKNAFFNAFFYNLVGNATLIKQVKEKKSARQIRKSWQSELMRYKRVRDKYLLYKDFE